MEQQQARQHECHIGRVAAEQHGCKDRQQKGSDHDDDRGTGRVLHCRGSPDHRVPPPVEQIIERRAVGDESDRREGCCQHRPHRKGDAATKLRGEYHAQRSITCRPKGNTPPDVLIAYPAHVQCRSMQAARYDSPF